MTTETTPSKSATWVRWIIYSLIGWGSAYALGAMVPTSLAEQLPAEALIGVQILISLGLAAWIATLQWLVLRGQFNGAPGWIMAGTFGMVIATFAAAPIKLYDLYIGQSGFQLDEVIYGAVFGLLLGVGQWYVLRRWLANAWWWVAASAAGWTLGMLVGELLPLDWSTGSSGLIYTLVTATLPAILTGAVLAKLPERQGAVVSTKSATHP